VTARNSSDLSGRRMQSITKDLSWIKQGVTSLPKGERSQDKCKNTSTAIFVKIERTDQVKSNSISQVRSKKLP